MFHILHTNEDVDAALKASNEKPVIIFKHSSSCPFSGAAQIEVAHAKHDLDIYGCVVQYTPEVKKEIADRLDVEHASPQAIVVYKGKAEGHFYRSEIKERALKNRVAELTAR
ncbi:DUF2847 family protein [Neolewinella aurantiaca]|uniref:DUF2847 family protein n=1 Tax=Neolewinella aurantiaca TaxID=2602767 RepID=A0A5C7FFD7_9BACT|nr:monothiol bacilliredoxin BrxC family protein [Neolewinella aurantiaca]TXF88313.1 DUF2847 family protein [Neolewinella aurantiaca]